MKASVYALKNTKNGRTFYGVTSDTRRSYLENMMRLYDSKHESAELQTDFNKIGEEGFSFKVLFKDINKREANLSVTEEIKKAKIKMIEPYNVTHKKSPDDKKVAGRRQKKITTSYTLYEDDINFVSYLADREGRSASSMMTAILSYVRKNSLFA